MRSIRLPAGRQNSTMSTGQRSKITKKRAQTVYSSVEGKMPTLKELSAEYEALKSEKEADDAALEELKPQLTTLNHIKYNFDVLERDYLPEEKDPRQEESPER